jgi:phosphohistidine phosphatase
MLYLVHHAEAVDALIDPQRPLTPSGHQHADDLARRAHARSIKPAAVWHSGKLRARQTAEPFWRLCNPLAEFAAMRGLQPADPPQWIKGAVELDGRDILLVGHMPHLSRLLNLLINRTPDGASEFPPHGLVALERLDAGWAEQWRE